MNKNTLVTLYYLVSVIFYIVAITKFINSGFSSGVIWLCLGSAFLCFGASAQSMNKKSDEDTSLKK